MNKIEIAPKYHPIARQNGNLSKQPRFSQVSPQSFFTSLYRFINYDIQEEPDYGERERDAWMRRIWKLEPYLAGVINSVVAIDKNRGWTVTGGRNQVRRFVNLFHNRFFFAPDLTGWRMSFGGLSQSYYTSDMGAITEIGRQGKDGPLDSLYFTDPARCYLTGDFDYPLKYTPAQGSSKAQSWGRNDYFRVVSLPSTDESLYGLGFCALSRCIELAKIMVGIYQYDNEMLLNRAPRGLLLLKGITEEQWIDAMMARKARLDGDEKRYYGAVHVLAALDPGVELEAQLVSLSQLPAEFDQQTFTDLLLMGYALCFGYDEREFHAKSGGSLGTATESEMQHRKAGAKGGLDFVLGFAERVNEELPDTVTFEFEERDLDSEMADAEVEQAKADVVNSIYTAGIAQGANPITIEEARIMYAERGLIDPDWTLNQEDTTASDTDDDVARALANERIQRAIWKYPDEPIVRYKWGVKNGREFGRYDTLLTPNRPPRRSFVVTRSFKARQFDSELEDYQSQLDNLAQQAVNGKIDQNEFEQQLEAITTAILVLALLRGKGGNSEADQLLIDASLMLLDNKSQAAYTEGMATLTDPAVLGEALSPEAVAELQTEFDLSAASDLGAAIYAGQYTDNGQGLLSRLVMWGTTATGLYNLGRLIGQPEQRFEWRYGPTDHCGDCARLNGQVHTGSAWQASGWRPQSRGLECNGYHCQCGIYPTDKPESGNF